MDWRANSPENPANPQDDYGKYHNLILDEISQSVPINLPVLDFCKESVNVFVQFYSKIVPGSDASTRDSWFEYATAGAMAARTQGRYVDIVGRTSAEYGAYINDLLDTVRDNMYDSPSEGISAVSALEATIAGSTMTAPEQEQAYAVSSIARYSIAYWNAQFGSGSNFNNNYWKRITIIRDEDPYIPPAPPSWVTADIWGAAIGGVFGNLPGALGSGAASSVLEAVGAY